MSKRLRLQSIFVAFALVATFVAGAFPAMAQTFAGATAELVPAVTDVTAGQSEDFVFEVTNLGDTNDDPADIINGEDPDLAINWVRIGPSTTGGDGTFTPSHAAAAGWSAAVKDLDGDGVSDAAVFTKADGIAATGEDLFTVEAAASVIPADELVEWTVEVSHNDGTDIQEATPVGSLATTIRVLNVDSVAVVSPNGVLDGTATAGQPNLTVESVVTNYGSAPLSIDPSLTSNGADTITDNFSSESIAAGATSVFSFPVALGGAAGNRTFDGDAIAAGAADAINDSSPVLTAQAATAFSYVNNTLQPRSSVSGATKGFVLTVSKTGLPAVALDASNTVLTLTNDDLGVDFSAALVSPTTIAGAGNHVLTFADVTIPGVPGSQDFDGAYTPTLTIEGVDENDAPVTRSVAVGNDFTIDNLVPFVDAGIDAAQVDASGLAVAKDGQSIDLDGTAFESAAPGAAADSTATVTGCRVVITDAANVVQETDTATCSVAPAGSGDIDGTYVLDSGALTEGKAFLEVDVADAAGNTTTARSDEWVRIDNVVPTEAVAFTGCTGAAPATTPFDEPPFNEDPLDQVPYDAVTGDGSCVETKTIRATFSEPVKGSFSALDFEVTGNQVTAAVPNCDASGFCSAVTLTLKDEFGVDDHPAVRYLLGGPLGDDFPGAARPTDGPGHELANGLFQTVDGIVPDLPDVATVTQGGLDSTGAVVENARGAQGGTFYTNLQVPTFEITGLGQDYTAIIAVDSNGTGDFEPGLDQIIVECLSGGDSTTCETLEPLAANTEYDLLVASKDADANLSVGKAGPLLGKRGRPLVLETDTEAPTAAAFNVSALNANEVTAALSEELGFGRNAAADWFVRDELPNGKFERFTTSSVSAPTNGTRLLTVNDGDYAAGEADQLLYTFQGSVEQRYQDRAGNYLSNFVLLAGGS